MRMSPSCYSKALREPGYFLWEHRGANRFPATIHHAKRMARQHNHTLGVETANPRSIPIPPANPSCAILPAKSTDENNAKSNKFLNQKGRCRPFCLSVIAETIHLNHFTIYHKITVPYS